jgi:hypothetical protein
MSQPLVSSGGSSCSFGYSSKLLQRYWRIIVIIFITKSLRRTKYTHLRSVSLFTRRISGAGRVRLCSRAQSKLENHLLAKINEKRSIASFQIENKMLCSLHKQANVLSDIKMWSSSDQNRYYFTSLKSLTK